MGLIGKLSERLFGTPQLQPGDTVVTWYDTAANDDDGELWTGYGDPPLPDGVTEDDLFRYKLSAYKDND